MLCLRVLIRSGAKDDISLLRLLTFIDDYRAE